MRMHFGERATSMTSTNPTKTVAAEDFTVSDLDNQELQAHLVSIRRRLGSNFDALEDKFDIPKQLGKAQRRCAKKINTMKEENPVGLAALAVGAVAAVGLTVFLVVKFSAKRY